MENNDKISIEVDSNVLADASELIEYRRFLKSEITDLQNELKRVDGIIGRALLADFDFSPYKNEKVCN